MAETPVGSTEQRQKLSAIETFVAGFVTGAKTVALYKHGHPIILQISERVVSLLLKALGSEPNLTLDLKAKNVLFEEIPLSETPETVAFAAALHTLGIGQVVFSNRVNKESLYEFFRVYNLKPEGKTTLSDIQKSVQQVRIDGIQMSYLLEFVVTGQEEASQTPGQLSEEQILAFIAAQTLPDFLGLLLAQNEVLIGKEAEEVTDLLDEVLNRDISAEKFSATMSWKHYDPRIKQRWEELLKDLAWQPRYEAEARRREPGARRWERRALVSHVALLTDADLAVIDSHHLPHETKEAVRQCLNKIHPMLEQPESPEQAAALAASYARLLTDLGKDNDVMRLMGECRAVAEMLSYDSENPYLKVLASNIRKKLVSLELARTVVQYLAGIGRESQGFGEVQGLVLFLGPDFLPPLLEQLRETAEKEQREKFCALLAAVAKVSGTEALVKKLTDEDYLLVSSVAAVLADLGAEQVPTLLPLLRHRHPKVREAAMKLLARFATPEAVEALAAFIVNRQATAEAKQAVTAISLLHRPGIDALLIEAYRRVTDYDMKVAIATALYRVPSEATRMLLEEAARRSLVEWLTGRNKALVKAAAQSLSVVVKDLKEAKAHG